MDTPLINAPWDIYHRPRTAVSLSLPPFESSVIAHITLTRQLWETVPRRPTKPDWPSLDSWSLSGTAITLIARFCGLVLFFIYIPATIFINIQRPLLEYLTSSYHDAPLATSTVRESNHQLRILGVSSVKLQRWAHLISGREEEEFYLCPVAVKRIGTSHIPQRPNCGTRLD
ncbi:hypothetical protein B0H13DRAFT_2147659 [Mycena leptocephala]|nr:hypothetical protein B0H13DRAFT_2147659 [Mycena leptocephala]